MGILVFAVLAAFTLISVILIYKAMTDYDGMGYGMMSIPSCLVSALLFAVPYLSHNNDLATVENQQRIIKIQTDYADKIKAQLDNMPKQDIALMNADSPISAMITALAESESKIRDANQAVLDAEISIQKRKRGMTSYILWFF